MNNSRRLYDVAIVGAGPTGVTLANLLGLYGLSVAIIERHPGILQIPRAVHIDGETMRVFQSARLAREVMQILRPGASMHWVNAEGKVLLIRKGQEGLSDQGWHNDYYFHQPHLEAVLRDGLKRFDTVALREGMDVRSYVEHDDRVELALSRTGDDAVIETLAARYVVGCDGARSTVRGWIGSDMEDLGQRQAWLVVDVNLHHPLPLPEHTVQHCDPARPATSIYVYPLRRRWEIQIMPQDNPETITQPERVWQLLSRWVKPVQGTLERAATYVFHSLVANRWQRGRLLIAGDAAHLTPPFLGQGLCAGVRDAANLAWKLAFAIQRGASDILATYGPERRPHVREFIRLAVEVGKVIQVTDPVEAAERDRKLLAEGLQFSFPRPQLGQAGAWYGELPAGQVFIQPMLQDGRWMDDVAGGRFSLLLHPAHSADLSAQVLDLATAADVVVLPLPDRSGIQWLEEHGARAVLLRPDRYVFEVITQAAQLASALGRVRALTCG